MNNLNVLIRLAGAVQKRKEEHSWPYHLFLTRSLPKSDTGKGYTALAKLIHQGYFSTILTSNTDTALEAALDERGLRPPQYNVIAVGQTCSEQIAATLRGPQSGIHIVKLYGDRSQIAQNPFPLTLSPDIQVSLQHYFNRNIIIVGAMDQEEDAVSALNFHTEGGIYYVRPDTPLSNDDIVVKCIHKQDKRLDDFLIADAYGEFNTFFSTLEMHISTRASHRQNSSPSPYNSTETRDVPPSHHHPDKQSPEFDENVNSPLEPVQTPELVENLNGKRTTVFISYSHQDTKYLKRLLTHLNHLNREGLINAWSDQKIKPGDDWQEQITQAVASARIAVLLISADFLASSFITEIELPALLEVSKKEGMTILPVVVSPCDYSHKELTRFQAVNDPFKPLSRMSSARREEVWKNLTEVIKEKLASDNLS